MKKKRSTYHRRNAYATAITRAEEILKSTPADHSREVTRRVHLSNEVLEAHYEEIQKIESSHVGVSPTSISTSRKTRGSTQGTSVIPLEGQKWKCLMIDGQPVRQAASKLATILRLYARMEGYFPPHKEWGQQSNHSFEDVVRDIMVIHFFYFSF